MTRIWIRDVEEILILAVGMNVRAQKPWLLGNPKHDCAGPIAK
jgi:hypothetical protein